MTYVNSAAEIKETWVYVNIMLLAVVITNSILLARALEHNRNTSLLENGTLCKTNSGIRVNCSHDHIDHGADVWEKFDSTGRFTRASVSAVIFVVLAVVMSVILKYKNKVVLINKWQFRYKKYSDKDGNQDSIYMVENDVNLTLDFDAVSNEIEEPNAVENDFKGVLLESCA